MRSPTRNKMSPITIGDERDAPPIFAGRDDDLAKLQGSLGHIQQTGSSRGGLVLVTGVPGIGKTSLVRRFAETCGAKRLIGGVSDLADPVDLFLSIGAAIDRESDFEKIAGVKSRVTGGGVGGSVAGVGSAKANFTREHARPLRSFIAMLRAAKPYFSRPLVIVLDELQRLRAHQADLLIDLHDGGHECPILAIGAGLQHTPEVLASHSISRVREPIQLQPLNEADTTHAVHDWLVKWDREAPDEVVERIAKETHGFPQHIYCYMKAAFESIDGPGDWSRKGALEKVLAEGHAHRQLFYDRRLMAMVDGRPRMMPVIARMMRDGETALQKRQAEAAVSEAGEDGKAAVADAIAHGVLTLGLDGNVSFGIPSFHTHMREVLRTLIGERPSQFPDRDIGR